MVLVHGRRDDAFAIHVAHDSARQHVCTAGRIEIVERVDGAFNVEHRDLLAVEVDTHAGVGDDSVERADIRPVSRAGHVSLRGSVAARCARSAVVAGRIWPRSGTKTTLSSLRSLLTKCRNRCSVSGIVRSPSSTRRRTCRRCVPCPLPVPRRCRASRRTRRLLHVIEPAFQVVEPRRRALQPVGGADIEHQESIDVTHSASRHRGRWRGGPRDVAACRRCRRQTSSSLSRSR